MDTSDSARATMSPGHVLYQRQNQHTQCDLEERVDVNDHDLKKHIYMSSCFYHSTVQTRKWSSTTFGFT